MQIHRLDNVDINVGGAIGKMENGLADGLLINQTIEPISGTSTTIGKETVLNFGGIVGKLTGGTIANSAFKSNVLTLDEMAFATFCTTLGIVCMVFYGFIGLVSVHGFGFGKGIASVIFTAIAIVIILFIVLLIATMAGELVTFVSTVAKEITLNYF